MKKIFIALLITFFTGNVIKAQCTCGASPDTRWLDITAKKNRTGPIQKIKCGFQLAITCKDTLWFTGGRYRCEGSCTATYKANISRGTTLVRTIDPFSFTTGFISFSEPGSYKLEIRPNCGGTSCKPCFYYFTVSDIGCRRT